MKRYTLQDLSKTIGARLCGDAHHEICGVEILEEASIHDASFLLIRATAGSCSAQRPE